MTDGLASEFEKAGVDEEEGAGAKSVCVAELMGSGGEAKKGVSDQA